MLNALRNIFVSADNSEAVFSNSASAIVFDKLGTKVPPYRPSYNFTYDFINLFHENISSCPLESGVKIDLGIKGSLRREDALKLYEMAYFSKGDILELGCNRGLSTYILSKANHDNFLKKKILTNDLDPRYVDITRDNLSLMEVEKKVELVADDAVQLCETLSKTRKKFGFCFVDHAHSYEPVYQVAIQLENIIKPGGFCLFHDYNDRRNPDPSEKDYGVAQAVDSAFDDAPFEFWGIYGCAALYRRI